MKQLNQYINWRSENRPPDPKPAKVPFDVIGQHRIDPLDPKNHMSFGAAVMNDPAHVGFVLTPEDDYFCVDIDGCWDGANWSPLALEICALFAGAYIEVSYSRNGLHIFGRGRVPDGYSTRGPGVECYTHSRFIAVTGFGARGDPNFECDAALATFAARYLKPHSAPGGKAAFEWTDKPVPEATPIPDDQELLRKMFNAKATSAQAFAGRAKPRDLWENNIPVLAETYPPDAPGKDYDYSRADSALASVLAFWTGKDCARIERLMRASKLVREKWDRGGWPYLRETIQNACATVQNVYTVKATGGLKPGDFNYLTAEMQTEHFAGCVYVTDQHRVFMPNGQLLRPEQFNASEIGGGFEYEVTPQGKPTKNAFEALTQNRMVKFPKADSLCFRPQLTPRTIIQEGPFKLLNTWTPPMVEVAFGPVDPFLNHMAKMYPVERDRMLLLSYIAAMRQSPGAKFHWCPLIQGTPGNGKSAIIKVAEYVVGRNYTHKANAKELAENGTKFTGWLEGRLLIVIEEIHIGDRRESVDSIKSMITDDRLEIQRKGADQYTGDNYANFMLTSNHKDAIIKTEDDRRFGMFYSAQQSAADIVRDGMGGDKYFPGLYGWLDDGGLANVAGYLQRLQIPDEMNPARGLHRAPVTSTTAEAIIESRGAVEQEIMGAVEEERPGFRGGWISSAAVAKLIDNMRRTIPVRRRGAIMRSLGYIPHPALPKGQCHTPVANEDGKRPVLYVKAGSLQAQHKNAQDAYCKAQGYFGAIYGDHPR
jgi:hypothetical protein